MKWGREKKKNALGGKGGGYFACRGERKRNSAEKARRALTKNERDKTSP